MNTEIERLKEDFDRKTKRLLENHRRELNELREDLDFQLESAEIVNAEEIQKQREKFEELIEEAKGNEAEISQSITIVQNSIEAGLSQFAEFKAPLTRLKEEHPEINWFWAELPLNEACQDFEAAQSEAYSHI